MKLTHLGIQTAIVLMMVALVSWPQFRPVRAQSVWRYPGTAQKTLADDAARYGADGVLMRTSLTAGQNSYGTAVSGSADAQMGGQRKSLYGLDGKTSFYTPTGVSALGGRLNALTGLARTSLNAPIAYAKLLLRDIRTGQVMGRVTANERGEFTFLDLNSSSYIVELLGTDGSVVAASPMVSMGLGDIRQTNVNAGASATSLNASFGNSLDSSMPQLTTVATNYDVTRTTPALSSEITSR